MHRQQQSATTTLPSHPKTLSIIIWNTKGLLEGMQTKFSRILTFAKANCDVLILTETHVDEKRFTESIRPFINKQANIQGHHWAFASDKAPWSGVACFNFSPTLSIEHVSKATAAEEEKNSDLKGRLMLLSITSHTAIETRPMNMAIIYAPPKSTERAAWYGNALRKALDGRQIDIMAGDFNCILHPSDSVSVIENQKEDSSLPPTNTREDDPTPIHNSAGALELAHLVDHHNLQDTLHILHKDPSKITNRFTFRSLTNSNRRSRLDRFYINNERLEPLALQVAPTPTNESGNQQPERGGGGGEGGARGSGNPRYDHFPLLLKFRHRHAAASPSPTLPLLLSQRGPGPFRANNNWFRDEAFVNYLTDTLSNCPHFATPTPKAGELMVLFLSEAAKQYKKYFEPTPPHIATQKNYEAALQYNQQQQTQNAPPSTYHSQTQLDALREDWLQALDTEAERANELSRLEANHASEHSCPRMTRWIQIRRRDRLVQAIRNQDNTLVSTPRDICQTFVDYYTNLYQKRPHCKESLNQLLQRWPTDLSNSQYKTRRWRKFSKPFTKDEVHNALAKSNICKSPGSTGLSYAPFKSHQLSKHTTPLLLALYNGIWSGSYAIPAHWKEVLITTIYKGKGAPEDLISSRRPISLLNTDYKIFSRMITVRIAKILKHFILPNQGGFLPRRLIQDNVIALYEAMHTTQLFKQHYPNYRSETFEPIIALFDFEKAFDRVNHDALDEILSMLGCPDMQRKVIMTLTSSMTARIIVNGFISESLPLRGGVRQGDPLAPLLFIATLEILNKAILSDPNCEGIAYTPLTVEEGAQGRRRRRRGGKLYLPPNAPHLWFKDRPSAANPPGNNKIITTNAQQETILKNQFRLGLFADDLAIGAVNSKAFEAQIQWIHIYCAATSAQLNLTKSEVLDLHESFTKVETLHQIPILRSSSSSNSSSNATAAAPPFTRYLGIWLTSDVRQPNFPIHHNYCAQLVQQISESMPRVSKLSSLSLAGRVTAINTYLLSKLNFVGILDPPSAKEIKALQKSIQLALWDFPVPRVRWDRLTPKKKVGGLTLSDITARMQALQATLWARHLDSKKPPFWGTAWHVKMRLGLPSPLAKRACQAWTKAKRRSPGTIADPQKPALRANSFYKALTPTLTPNLAPSAKTLCTELGIDCTKAFPHLWTLPVRPALREFYWRTLAKCQKRDYSATRPPCPLCHQESNTLHMIRDCHVTQFIFTQTEQWFQSTFNRPWQGANLNYKAIWNLESTLLDSCTALAALYFVWKSWNAHLHNEPSKASPHRLSSYLRSEIRTSAANALYKLTQFGKSPSLKKLQKFDKEWAIGTLLRRTHQGIFYNE